jgi:hypothetical protein
MVVDISTLFEGAGGAITAVGGLWAGWRHIRYSLQAKKDKYRQDIIDQAKEEMTKIKVVLENKIKVVEIELQTQKESVSKDLSHLKEGYSSEVKILGQRIEELRQDLAVQHGSLVALLTRLVDPK